MTGKSFFLVPVLILLTAQLSVGQIPSNPDSALQTILNSVSGTPLSPLQAIQHGLDNATSVRRADAAYLSAAGLMRKEAGRFDRYLFFNLHYLGLTERIG